MLQVITSREALGEVVKEPHRAVAEKSTDHIDAESRRFLEASPFFLLATMADDGSCDVSPRGDPAGSVIVLDDRTLAFGDRRGNRRLDSLLNILERPQVGMLFMIPGIGDTLRVNGTATWPDRKDVPTAGQIARSQHGFKVPARMIDAALRLEARRNQY
ncbi:pyridoxamine 5'-phosphate oxidase family protein [Pseudonocardia sp. GCM10023141]|uniref:pyridoxamine 5'-phosphate oxidase family protein n=1 Tax=Pseudonocardia sp. GCM10023141 TaxID=3252653 RepID=UPI003605EA6B